MKGPRWVLTSTVTGNPVAELHGNLVSKKMAEAFGQLISDRTNFQLRMEKVRTNPTLVHHGYARRAAWHVTGPHDQPLAELYFGTPTTAKTIGHMLSDLLAMPIRMYENTEYGSPPLEQHNRFEVTSRRAAGSAPVRGKRNPSPSPLPGQRWMRRGGGSVKVTSVGDGRVAVTDMDTGNREWVDRDEFLARYRPGFRPNPKRKRPLSRASRRSPDRTGTSKALGRGRSRSNPGGPRIVYNKLLGGWYVVVGPHQTPLNGRFNSKAEAQAWLARPRSNPPRSSRKVRRAAASGRFVKARHHASASVKRGVRRLDLQRRRAFKVGRNPRPTTVREAVAQVLAEAKFPQLVKEVRSGKADPLAALQLARKFMSSERQRAIIDAAIRLVRKVGPQSNPRGRKLSADVSVGDVVSLNVGQYFGRYATVEKIGREWITVRVHLTGKTLRVKPGMYHLSNPSRKGRQKRRTKVRGKALRNPRESDVARARRTFTRLNEIEPGRVTRVKTTRGAPKVLAKIGELVSIQYRSDKYAGSPDNPHGKTQLYEHRTKRPRPVLATDPSGREVHIVGGRMHPTPDGLVN